MKKIYFKYTCPKFPQFLNTIYYKKHYFYKGSSYREKYILVKTTPALVGHASEADLVRWKKPNDGILIVNNQLTQVCSICYSENCPGFVERNIYD